MALNHTIIKKINAKAEGKKSMARDLAVLLNRCEEGRQTKRAIEDMLKKLKNS